METWSVFFIFTAGVSTSNFQPHQSTLSSQNRDPTKRVRSCERWDRLKVPIQKESHLLVYARGHAQIDYGL